MDDKIIKYYTVETYALFMNTDESILQVNGFLKKFGYRFYCYDLQRLEKEFSDLFSLPQKFESEHNLEFIGSNITITNEFHNILQSNTLYGHQLLFDKKAILLKRIKNWDQKVVNNTIDVGEAMKAGAEMQNFVRNLLQELRLFKEGGIWCPIQFQISKKSRRIRMKFTGGPNKVYGNSVYALSETEIKELRRFFSGDFKANALTDLAIRNFNLAYEILDLKVKYITLMTCLESIFNLGRDQITHTVSRHLALIISRSEDEFKTNYCRIKELYSARSSIVHGQSIKEDLDTLTLELESKVRKAINYCVRLSDTRKEFFDKLNSFGFRSKL